MPPNHEGASTQERGTQELLSTTFGLLKGETLPPLKHMLLEMP